MFPLGPCAHGNLDIGLVTLQQKRNALQKNVAVKKPTEKAIEELSDSEITDKQKAFVLEYLRISNATQAYINVYDVDRETDLANGPRLLGFKTK